MTPSTGDTFLDHYYTGDDATDYDLDQADGHETVPGILLEV